MKAGQHNRSGRGNPDDSPTARRPRALQAHPAFAPIIGVWGASLGGLVVLVLPFDLVAEAMAGTGFAALGEQLQWLLAGIAALATGVSLYLIAGRLSARAQAYEDSCAQSPVVSSRMRPLDPANDLGSGSFDEPLEDRPVWAPATKVDCSSEENAEWSDPTPAAAPRELDLAQFAEKPASNEGLAEEQRDQSHQEAATPKSFVPLAPTEAPPNAAALALLRAVPPEELSTVQMVERFAAALHEHRDPVTGRANHAAREAALAEALKALAALSVSASAPNAREPLRDSIAQLRPRRGAA